MAGICDNIPLDRIEFDGEVWGPGKDFQLDSCCTARTLVFIYKNNTGADILIDNTEHPFCGLPVILDVLGNGDPDIDSVTEIDFTTGTIPDGEEFNISVTIDPSMADCTKCFGLLGMFRFFPSIANVDGCCTIQQSIQANVISKIPPTVDLGTQGNADGFLQMTTVVGQTVTKVISITNNDCVSRTYTITEPACWAGRLDADEDPFTPFVVAAGGSKSFILSYTPTGEEIDCCTFEYTDECETPYEFVVCYEAVQEDPSDPIDPIDPGGGTGGGGTPPCQGVIDCNVKMTTEQLIRAITVKDVNGCPAIKIILT